LKKLDLNRRYAIPRARFQLAGLAVLFVFGLLGLRFWHLQVWQGQKFRDIAAKNQLSKLFIPAQRGSIFDRKGKKLVGNEISYDLVYIPQITKNPSVLLDKVSELLEKPLSELRRRTRKKRSRKSYVPVTLVRDLSPEQRSIIENHRSILPGIEIVGAPRRSYSDAVSPHMVGYIGEIKRNNLAAPDKPYKAGDFVGKTGLEKTLETKLRGEDGFEIIKVDAYGRRVPVDDIQLPFADPIAGQDIQLTIDTELQRAAQKAFAGKKGAVVVLDVKTGGILAMLSEPAFRLKDFRNQISQELWDQLGDDPYAPLLDKTTAGQYPPGSTYKIIAAAAGLETPETQRHTSICNGSYRLGNKTFHCHKRSGHGFVNYTKALKWSCDVFFYELGLKLGIDKIAEYARDFGLGSKLGLGLNAERYGLVPTRAWHMLRHGRRWPKGETPNAVIGQGFNLTTPLQLATMMTALGVEGSIKRPHLLHRIRDHDGKVIFTAKPETIKNVELVSESTRAKIREILRRVVEDGDGTGGRSRVVGLKVGGKTGTAQVVGLDKTYKLSATKNTWKEHALFVAMAPNMPNNPTLLYRYIDMLIENRNTTHIYTGLGTAFKSSVVSHSRVYTIIFVALYVILITLGTLNLYSATMDSSYFTSHAKHLFLAVSVFAITAFFLRVSYLRGLSLAGFWGVCILLALVLLIGVELKGSKRWINLGVFYLQPSEMAKIAVIFLVAHFASSYRRLQAYKLWELFPIGAHLLLLFGLVVVEPDLGTAAVCLMIGCVQLAFLRVERSSLYYLFAGATASATVGWIFLLRDYQKLRILNFINPERDPFGSGYNIHQSLIAVGSGGWFGKGWLEGSQTQLEFLPARHTDFVMSVFAEENGFLSVLGILGLFFILIYASLSLAKKFRDNFMSFLAIGFGALFFLQIAINLAMILGWFPVVGIPLPFFTKGGTSLIVYSFAMGCLVAISRELKPMSTNALGSGQLYSRGSDGR